MEDKNRRINFLARIESFFHIALLLESLSPLVNPIDSWIN